MTRIPFLPLSDINARQAEALQAAACRVIASGWYLRGTETAAFERKFADYIGTSHCIGVANGLDALTLIFTALKLRHQWADGDEVLVPAMTFIATAEAVERARLRPIFAEVTQEALIDPTALAARLSERTRAVCPVHLYGQMATACLWSKTRPRPTALKPPQGVQARSAQQQPSAFIPGRTSAHWATAAR